MTESDQIEKVLEDTLAYSRERNYVGWDKHDGMSSRVRQWLPFEHKWTNLLFQETIKRAPVNLRPLFLVEQRPNPKGLSLFTLANLNAYSVLGDDHYRDEARELAERVISHDVDGYDGFCLPHNHELQGLSGKKAAGKPNVVSTSYGVKALMEAEKLDDKYAKIARTAADFLETELYTKVDGHTRINYTPNEDPKSLTLNANALAARLLLDIYEISKEKNLKETATEILSYVANRQAKIGGWEYRDPPSSSHLGMDNYHNGFIIESFLRYQEVAKSDKFNEVIDSGIEFYRNRLYEENGAPCWDEKSSYPRDIHAAAQGIVVFSKFGDLDFARQIIEWVLNNLYSDEGLIYYQQTKLITKKFSLMRWCQAWMAYSISYFLDSIQK